MLVKMADWPWGEHRSVCTPDDRRLDPESNVGPSNVGAMLLGPASEEDANNAIPDRTSGRKLGVRAHPAFLASRLQQEA